VLAKGEEQGLADEGAGGENEIGLGRFPAQDHGRERDAEVDSLCEVER
jgi:hypothetical protein